MKTLITLLLCCLTMLGIGQDISPTASNVSFLANPLPQGKIVANGNRFAVQTATGLKDVTFFGTSLNFDALNWGTPDQNADRLANDGQNLIRPHHENATIERLEALAKAYAKRGMYFAIDVADDAFITQKLLIYEKDPAVRTRLLSRMDRLKPLLDEPNLAYVACVNEGATPLRGKYNANRPKLDELATETYQWFKAELAKRGYRGLVGDLADGSIDAVLFGPIVAKQDIILLHAYGTHNQGKRYRDENWALNGHFLGSNIYHINLSRQIPAVDTEGRPIIGVDLKPVMLAAPKPAVMQEMACMFPNSQRAYNEVSWYAEMMKRDISAVAFCYAANQAQMRGTFTEVDDFALVTDPARLTAFRGGALIYKYGGGQVYDSYWGALLNPVKRDPNYRCKWQKVSVNIVPDGGSIVVRASSTKAYVLLLDQVMHKGLATKDVGDGWREIVSRGGLVFGFWDSPARDIGAPVSGAYRLNLTTLKQEPTLTKAGTTMLPDRSMGLFMVNTSTAIPLPEPPVVVPRTDTVELFEQFRRAS